MNIVRKTVRFHTDNTEDVKILRAVSDYKSYGFHSTSDMILAALRKYLADNGQYYSPEELAYLIADRLSGKLILSSSTESSNEKETPDVNDALDAALNFINSL